MLLLLLNLLDGFYDSRLVLQRVLLKSFYTLLLLDLLGLELSDLGIKLICGINVVLRGLIVNNIKDSLDFLRGRFFAI